MEIRIQVSDGKDISDPHILYVKAVPLTLTLQGNTGEAPLPVAPRCLHVDTLLQDGTRHARLLLACQMCSKKGDECFRVKRCHELVRDSEASFCLQCKEARKKKCVFNFLELPHPAQCLCRYLSGLVIHPGATKLILRDNLTFVSNAPNQDIDIRYEVRTCVFLSGFVTKISCVAKFGFVRIRQVAIRAAAECVVQRVKTGRSCTTFENHVARTPASKRAHKRMTLCSFRGTACQVAPLDGATFD